MRPFNDQKEGNITPTSSAMAVLLVVLMPAPLVFGFDHLIELLRTRIPRDLAEEVNDPHLLDNVVKLGSVFGIIVVLLLSILLIAIARIIENKYLPHGFELTPKLRVGVGAAAISTSIVVGEIFSLANYSDELVTPKTLTLVGVNTLVLVLLAILFRRKFHGVSRDNKLKGYLLLAGLCIVISIR